ncbi:MAG: hypothetical protein MJ124_07880 [Lachnospiraceae bacterium]|nr:hypothetical protein [Lachnospiraceae bacterium]
MDIGFINSVGYTPTLNQNNLQSQANTVATANTASEGYIASSSALVANELVPVAKEVNRKEKSVWVAPAIKEGAAEIKKEQGLSPDAPVFIERRHRIQAVKYDRRKESRNRTLMAEDARGMNDHEKAERTNKVGEYCLQRFGKTAPRNGGRFDLNC